MNQMDKQTLGSVEWLHIEYYILSYKIYYIYHSHKKAKTKNNMDILAFLI